VLHGHSGLGEVGDDAVEEAEFPGVQLDVDGERMAEHLVHRDVRVVGEQGEIVAIGRAQRLLSLEGFEQQNAIVQRACDQGIAS